MKTSCVKCGVYMDIDLKSEGLHMGYTCAECLDDKMVRVSIDTVTEILRRHHNDSITGFRGMDSEVLVFNTGEIHFRDDAATARINCPGRGVAWCRKSANWDTMISTRAIKRYDEVTCPTCKHLAEIVGIHSEERSP